MNTLLVTSTTEGIGKTAIALALGVAARDSGHDVGYMKPKGTRLQSAVGKTRDEDPMLARSLFGLDAEMHEMEPIVYSPTFVQAAVQGREDLDELRGRVVDTFSALSAETDLMIVEGSGGLATGTVVDLTDGDIAAALDARVVLVTRYDEIRDTDRILAAAERLGDSLAGVLFNDVADAARDELVDDVVPFLEGRDVPVLGALPHVTELAGLTVEELADSVGAEILTNRPPTTTVVERFTVGAMGANSALEHFRRSQDAVLITGGDRSEIQTAAFEASGIEAFLLTGGHEPPRAVRERAEEEGVPIMLVQSDTRTTVDRAERELRSGRTRDETTVEQMGELLAERVDLEAILDLDL
ncbi:MAG: phosphotransacetylase family protein [Haloarculaceae archaeon]